MCHSKRPDAGTFVDVRITSVMLIGGARVSSGRMTGEVSELPVRVTSRVAPAGALPVTTEWRAVFAVLSIAIR